MNIWAKSIAIVLVMLMIGLFPFVSAENSRTGATASVKALSCEMYRTAEFVGNEYTSGSPIGTTGAELYNGRTVITPWWVDIVDAESQDVSVDDRPVYIAVLDTGLIPAYASVLPTERLDLVHAKAYTVDWTWDTTAGDFVAGSVKEKTNAVFNPAWKGYINEPYGTGHGTSVASTIIGYYISIGGVPYYVRGVSPTAKVIPVLVLDSWFLDCPDTNYPGCHGGKVIKREGTASMVAAGIKYIADLKATLDAPVIISMSIANYVKPTDMSVKNAIDYAIEKGCIVVAGAGNGGENGMSWPGAFSEVISCAAAGWTETFYISGSYTEAFWRSDKKDVPENLKTTDAWSNTKQIFLEDFSSRPNKTLGQKANDLDVAAPGASLMVPYKNGGYWSGSSWILPGWGYYWMDGTSFATPEVSSIASIVVANYPNADQDDMEKVLRNAASGEPLPCNGAYESGYGWNTLGLTWHKWKGTDYGSGFLQADSAMKSAGNLLK